MNEALRKFSRCAIYTRKSTEHNLDLAFTSLDAQREACEAYIKSQAQPKAGGSSATTTTMAPSPGASLERPALQRLLADLRGRRIDIVVVYKVDRLTRSLADFAKLIELFDAAQRLVRIRHAVLQHHAPAWGGSRSMCSCPLPSSSAS